MCVYSLHEFYVVKGTLGISDIYVAIGNVFSPQLLFPADVTSH